MIPLRRVLVLATVLVVVLSLPFAFLIGPSQLRDYAYRELAYRVIADEVTKHATTEREVVDSLFEFVGAHQYKTNANVMDLPAFDSLVRGIAWCDQQSWTLATLLAKKAIPASMLMLRGDDAVSHHTVATVYVSGAWRIVDPFYGLRFFEPSGELATFEDLERPDRRAGLVSPRADAIQQYHPGFEEGYFKLFAPQYEPIQWQPLTEKKQDPARRTVAAVIDLYVKVFGSRFVDRFQDAYLFAGHGRAPDDALFLRARHYDLLFRSDQARAAYRRLLTEYPDSPHAEDALYFYGRLQEERQEWAGARDTLQHLIDRFGENGRWAGLAHYFKGVANDALGDVSTAVKDYEMSAASTDDQVDWPTRLNARVGPPARSARLSPRASALSAIALRP